MRRTVWQSVSQTEKHKDQKREGQTSSASRLSIPRRLIFDTHFQQFDPPNALPLACLACLNRWAS